MTTQDSINLIHRFFEAVNRHDVDGVLACLDPDVEWLFSGQTARGYQFHRRFLENLFRAFPDYKDEITNLLASDGAVAVEYTSRGTHNGLLSLPTGQVLPTGRKIEMHNCDVYKIGDGKIVAGHIYVDTAELLRDLGQLPGTKQAGAQ